MYANNYGYIWNNINLNIKVHTAPCSAIDSIFIFPECLFFLLLNSYWIRSYSSTRELGPLNKAAMMLRVFWTPNKLGKKMKMQLGENDLAYRFKKFHLHSLNHLDIGNMFTTTLISIQPIMDQTMVLDNRSIACMKTVYATYTPAYEC